MNNIYRKINLLLEDMDEIVDAIDGAASDKISNYSDKESELLKYLRRGLPQESFGNMQKEITAHSEPGMFDDAPKITRGYNQGFVNQTATNMFGDDAKNMTRAEVAAYVDSLYGNIEGKDNAHMDYGDAETGILSKIKDFFGKANDKGNFDDTYMKNMDAHKLASVNKVMDLRDDLKRYS